MYIHPLSLSPIIHWRTHSFPRKSSFQVYIHHVSAPLGYILRTVPSPSRGPGGNTHIHTHIDIEYIHAASPSTGSRERDDSREESSLRGVTHVFMHILSSHQSSRNVSSSSSSLYISSPRLRIGMMRLRMTWRMRRRRRL